MIDPVFCCSRVEPHKPTKTENDPKFSAFRNAAMNNDIQFLSKSRKNSLTKTPSPERSASTTTSKSGSGTFLPTSISNEDFSFAPGNSTFTTSPSLRYHSGHGDEDDNDSEDDTLAETPYIIQAIRRFDAENIEWVRYFTNTRGNAGGRRAGWIEVDGEKVGDEWCVGESFKKFGCKYHFRLFEINIFERES